MPWPALNPQSNASGIPQEKYLVLAREQQDLLQLQPIILWLLKWFIPNTEDLLDSYNISALLSTRLPSETAIDEPPASRAGRPVWPVAAFGASLGSPYSVVKAGGYPLMLGQQQSRYDVPSGQCPDARELRPAPARAHGAARLQRRQCRLARNALGCGKGLLLCAR